MSLITLDDISLEFGDLPLLLHANLSLEANERVCLIGRNGAGKSTLLKMIMGEQEPDSGEIRYRQALRVSQLHQALPDELDQSVHDFVAGGLVHLGQLITDYHALSSRSLDNKGLRELEDLQQRIEAEGGWNLDQRVETILSELDIPAERRLSEMSGGWQRRASLARALVSNPELLLLDEPTNHLDLAAIEWLEDRIRNFDGSVLFITHDRAFLQRLATRIVELDRTQLTSWPGDYNNYLRRKEGALHAESLDKHHFEKKLSEEEAWIRTGIKARRTRNEGRVRALEAMRKEYAERQKLKRQPKARIHIEESENESGRKVIELHNVCHGYEGKTLINRLTHKVMRGDRIGLIGNNGVGKSTLLKIMLGEITPDSGTVKLGTNIDIGYFDQMRRELDPNKSIAEIVGDGREYIRLNGKDRHVIGYLRGFLFSAKRAMTPVRALSGGEKNRVILARLFTRPTNLLVLDEPTNDLDVETLEVLEQQLIEYEGTLIVVSHDREFLDNAVTSVLVFEEGGHIQSYAGGYSQWLQHGRRLEETDDLKPAYTNTVQQTNTTANSGKKKKLSYKYQLELEQLPDRIEQLENEIEQLQQQAADPAFYDQSYEKVQPVLDQLKAKQDELDAAMNRWDELESQSV